MSTKTYQGSCHCGAVRFEVDLDLASASGRCNCSFCSKSRAWGYTLKPEAIRLLAGSADLGGYQFGTKQGHHHFCKHCGIAVFSQANVPELGGPVASVRVAALDLEPSVLSQIPIKYVNGRGDDWMHAPAITSYL